MQKTIKYNFFSYELVVRAGTENPRLISSIEKKILRHISHPKYEGTFYFDVALIILEEVSFIDPRIKDIGHRPVWNLYPNSPQIPQIQSKKQINNRKKAGGDKLSLIQVE